MARLFVAVDVPSPAAQAAAGLQSPLPGARWVGAEQLHLTLRFLGETPAGAVEDVERALATVRAAPFELALEGVGVFPPRRGKPPRVLWAGVAPEAPLQALKEAIDAVLGPDAEAASRPFSPHLTLARFREPPGAALAPLLASFMARHAAFATAPWPVRDFQLYRSTLGPGAARHDLLARYRLATAA